MKQVAQTFLLASVFSMFGASGAFAAQTALGIQGGANFGSAMVDPADSTSMQTGIIGGAFFELAITDMFSFQPEIMYERKSATAVNKSVTTTYKLDYLSIPLLAKAKLMPFGIVTPFVFLGPNVGIKTAANFESTAGNATSQGSIIGIKSTDINIDFGFGGDFKITSAISAVLSARYSLGMIDIDSSPLTWRPRGIQVLSGLKLALGN